MEDKSGEMFTKLSGVGQICGITRLAGAPQDPLKQQVVFTNIPPPAVVRMDHHFLRKKNFNCPVFCLSSSF